MNLLVIAGRLSRHRFGSSGTVAPVVDALGARGNRVRLVCASVDVPDMFPAVERVEAFGPHTTSATDWPLGFARWARARARATPSDAVLSFSRVVGGDVWFPVEPSAAAWFGRARSAKSVRGLAYACVRHHGFARAMVVESFRRTPLTHGGMAPRAIVAVGPTCRGEAVRLLTPAGLDDAVVQAPFFSTLGPLNHDDRADLRRRVRGVLGLDPEARVLFAAAPMAAGRELDDLFRALADVDARRAPVLIVACKESFALHTRAVKLGADARVRFVGRSARPDAMLAAADACVLPIRAGGGWRGLFESGATGRLAADALRLGRPLVAASGSHGYDLARTTLDDASRPGLIVDSTGVAGWTRALRTALDDRWLADASAAAERVGAGLGLDALVDLLEAAIAADPAAARAASPLSHPARSDALPKHP